MKTFLSSTLTDLVNYRKAAIDAIERLGQQVGRMELFGARAAEASVACLAEIDECDVFVGIYAYRHGFIPDGSEVSITEAEFEYAKANGQFLLCFFVEENHPWPPKMIEDEPGRSKLVRFKAKIGSNVVRDTFTTCEDLAYKIAASLGRHLSASGNKSTYTEFFQKIVAELAYLRKGVRDQKDSLARVNHVSNLLPQSNENAEATLPMHKKLPSGSRRMLA